MTDWTITIQVHVHKVLTASFIFASIDLESGLQLEKEAVGVSEELSFSIFPCLCGKCSQNLLTGGLDEYHGGAAVTEQGVLQTIEGSPILEGRVHAVPLSKVGKGKLV